MNTRLINYREQKAYNKMILDILEGKRDEKVLCDAE